MDENFGSGEENCSVKQLDFSESFYIERALAHYDEEDWLGVLKILNEREERYDPSADSTSMYAEAYDELGLYRLSVDNWLRFLDTCNELDFHEGFWGLGQELLKLGVQTGGSGDRENLDNPFSDFKMKRARNLKIVHTDGDDAELLLRDGSEALQMGDFEGAREYFSQIKPESKSYPYASGLVVMCLLMEGRQEEAMAECETLLSRFPDDLHGLTTYCAVLNASGRKEEAKEVAGRIGGLETDSPEEIMRAGLALGESGLDEEAYHRFKKARELSPYQMDPLFYLAVASYRTGRLEEAIEALEMLTLVDHRREVAKYYLERLREKRDAPEREVSLGYAYKIPPEERSLILSFYESIMEADAEGAKELGGLPSAFTFFRLAFDNLEGRDEELIQAALPAACKSRSDKFLRDLLLDTSVSMELKLEVLEAVVMRNEENSFGIVLCDFYREFFTGELELGCGFERKFLKAFAEIYTRFYLIDETNENRLLSVGEDIYRGIIDHGKEYLFECRKELCAAIVREARLESDLSTLEDITKEYNADVEIVEEILDCVL